MPQEPLELTVEDALARLLALWEAEPGTPEAGEVVALLEALAGLEDGGEERADG